MTDVDKVALWTGLISSIVGIVLSVVAIVLSIVSNNRATAVNDQTIKSLQKIESDVERLADDSRTLIKAGWDKMLGNFDPGQTSAGDDDASEESTQMVNAINKSLPATTANQASDPIALVTPDERLFQLESKIEDLQHRVALQRSKLERGRTPTQYVDELVGILSNLSPRAQALFEIISRSRHLTQKQLGSLENSELAVEVTALREAGTIVPLTGRGTSNGEIVYWLPTRFARAAKVATQLAPRISPNMSESVTNELKKVGYVPR